ncbi:uncharacterized protein OCT59_013677 [Rhizophagus irregularis]|uniref:MIR domain-containing protein n=2 Tax=Rhizophagus irregularis TaxID=588596 RepID=A0A015KBS5_RHIIW|nr:hypothetical protein RirG_027730 [Rhizophagus irregularis DAOM 197198w]UZO21279.1 hypothetical protein OCT59_013677 [Rhizophagus irregularis]
MGFPKYDGNIHPDEWIKDIQKYNNIWKNNYGGFLNTAISLIDPTIKLPTEINDIENLRNALKEDVSFKVFKITNKRKLQSLKYNPKKDDKNSKFILKFRKLCYNAEINDIEEQKKYLYKSLPADNNYTYFLTEFLKRMENVNSMNELIKEFEEIITDEANLIKHESTVTLKHVPTGKYLTSVLDLNYTTRGKNQLVFAGNSNLDPNALWNIRFFNLNNKNNNKVLASYTETSNYLLHHKVTSRPLGVPFTRDFDGNNPPRYNLSPSSSNLEVSCNLQNCYDGNWEISHSKLENHQGYLKSNDTINLSLNNLNGLYKGPVRFLRSHDIQFTIENDTFQEVVCHNETVGENDEWCIELDKNFNS